MLDRSTDRPRRVRRIALQSGVGLWLVLLLASAVFQPALTGPFLFDDAVHLELLRHVGGQFDLDAVRRLLAALGSPLNRPLSMLSFLLEDWAWPSDPHSFKRGNLAWHLLVGVLMFALGRAIASRLGCTSPRREGIALALCAAWILHPLQLSATMLVVQRMNILASMFILLGLLIYLRVLAGHGHGARRALTAWSLLSLAAALAFLCKQNGILIFAYAAVLNYCVLARDRAGLQPATWRLLCLGTALPLLLLAAAAAANPDYVLAPYRSRDFTLGERLLTQPRVLWDYMRIILLPRVGGQGLYHDDFPASTGLFEPPSTSIAMLTLFAVAVVAFQARRRFPVLSFATLWFLAGHLMESSFIGLELYFEHRNYLPMAGPLFGLAWLVFHLRRYRAFGFAVLACWLALCIGLTAFSAPIWGDQGKLALVWLRENPGSVRAIQLAGAWLHDVGDYEQASKVFRAGIARRPGNKELEFQRVLLECLNVGVEPRQWDALVEVARSSNNARVIPEVISAFRIQTDGPACRGTLRREQVRRLAEALMQSPAIAREPIVLGFLHYELARLAEQERDLDAVMRHLDQSNRFRPDPMIPREQAIHLLTAGLPEEALEYLDLSDRMPQSPGQAMVQDMAKLNAPLRRSAERMIEDMRGTGATPGTSTGRRRRGQPGLPTRPWG